MPTDQPNTTEWTDEEIEDERQRTIAKLTEREPLEELMLRYQNPYGAREALHTAYIFNENVDQYLTEHPVVALIPRRIDWRSAPLRCWPICISGSG